MIIRLEFDTASKSLYLANGMMTEEMASELATYLPAAAGRMTGELGGMMDRYQDVDTFIPIGIQGWQYDLAYETAYKGVRYEMAMES